MFPSMARALRQSGPGHSHSRTPNFGRIVSIQRERPLFAALPALRTEANESYMKMKDVLFLTLGARDQKCPGEVDVLAYSENRLSAGQRVRIERHFTVCDDCRELLTFLGQESVDKSPVASQEEVSEQASRVLGYIRNDEIGRTESRQPARSESGFRISYSKLASLGLVVATIVVAVGVLLAQRQKPA